jgi:hypothetical protein
MVGTQRQLRVKAYLELEHDALLAADPKVRHEHHGDHVLPRRRRSEPQLHPTRSVNTRWAIRKAEPAAIRNVWESAHAAVSRRPPIPLDRIVARTRTYTYAAKVWDVSLIQRAFSVAPCQLNPTSANPVISRFATFFIAVPREELREAATASWCFGFFSSSGPAARARARTPSRPPPRRPPCRPCAAIVLKAANIVRLGVVGVC